MAKFRFKMKMETNLKGCIKMASESQEEWSIVKQNVYMKGHF
jgi:hypothetical protein